MIKQQNKKKNILNIFKDKRFILMLVILAVLIVIGIIVYSVKYSPSKERMSLEEYFELKEGEMAVIDDEEYIATRPGSVINGFYRDNMPYVKIDIVNKIIEDTMVYDSEEHIVRYTTPNGINSTSANQKSYTNNGVTKPTNFITFIEENNTAYIALGFVKETADISYTFSEEPNRVVVHKAGKERTVAKIDGDIPMRRFGGVKSKILKDAKDGEEVTVIENYGRWSLVISEDGVLGCVKNSNLEDKEKITNKGSLDEVKYTHNHLKERVRMGWFQATNVKANDYLGTALETAKGMNVICPTWLQMKDNSGSIVNVGSKQATDLCHSKGLKVFALVGNIERDVDEKVLFNKTSSRDNLINNIIIQAESIGVDGINVDVEAISATSLDGYIEFIKELSIKCKEKNLILSVDNYTQLSNDYDVEIQAKYADYIVLMGYDEHWSGGDEAGSNASIGFVKDGIKAMLDLGVEKDQLILGIPFYTRLWTINGTNISSKVVSMKETDAILKTNNAQKTWNKECGQYFAEWNNIEGQQQIWIEDNKSLEEKINVVNDKELAGISAWKLGYEDISTWEMIEKKVK